MGQVTEDAKKEDSATPKAVSRKAAKREEQKYEKEKSKEMKKDRDSRTRMAFAGEDIAKGMLHDVKSGKKVVSDKVMGVVAWIALFIPSYILITRFLMPSDSVRDHFVSE
eukprot:gnl/MRDRNA2_/MRDRNA2_91278_c0_seq1.p1 gnl/MRDRNA2_/MRDRNA2_91278_c0~~gnl/MRDRNA2_/MRDRNA2_91278_c0_seq1.p1  ORF type:complete len:110 (+),score=34.88 gnl/MRDRNA2_/MRDRNA2_91278_c0_seq1:88-417(+)